MHNAGHLTILNYHGVEKEKGEYPWLDVERPYVISLKTFEEQLDLLLENGFKTLTMGELEDWVEGRCVYAKPVVLTFDDGHIGHYQYVVSALSRRHFKGAFFIPAGLVGQQNHMGWEELKSLVASGFEVGSHGVKHIPLSDLSHHELWKELDKSKSTLERELGVPIKGFSVPRGYYQIRIREVAMELGYKFLFTSRFDVNEPGHDPWRLNRIAVKRNLSRGDFLRFVHGDLGYKRVVEQMKEAARRFVKPSFYDALADLKRTLTHG
ncbi:MAG: polysaccharide deacetylase family protein [Candidatus Omnitrophica bacterium]|nr:polysaccharide deacetylase family protein [Candidatus Omnitrophota bacterium]